MPQSPEQSEDEEENKSESEKMWDRHIARIKRNDKNN